MRSAPVAAPPLIESLGLLERAVGYTRLSLQLVRPPHLSNPTPCAAWDLELLLLHMHDSMTALTQAADLGRVPITVPDGPSSPVLAVELLRVHACSLLSAWSAVSDDFDVAIGDQHLSSSMLACAGALEVALHGWDVAQAVGRPRPLPDALAQALTIWAPVFVTAQDRPHRFAPALDVPMGGASERVLALVGRRAH